MQVDEAGGLGSDGEVAANRGKGQSSSVSQKESRIGNKQVKEACREWHVLRSGYQQE